MQARVSPGVRGGAGFVWVKQLCPKCRTELPLGPEKLHKNALRLNFMIQRRIERGESLWNALMIENLRICECKI